MTINQLSYLITIAETGSLNKAAELLYISQPSLSGAVQELEKELGIKCGEGTEEGMFSIDSCRCVGACGLAPVMMINEDVHGKLTPEMVKGILDGYKKEAQA